MDIDKLNVRWLPMAWLLNERDEWKNNFSYDDMVIVMKYVVQIYCIEV